MIQMNLDCWMGRRAVYRVELWKCVFIVSPCSIIILPIHAPGNKIHTMTWPKAIHLLSFAIKTSFIPLNGIVKTSFTHNVESIQI